MARDQLIGQALRMGDVGEDVWLEAASPPVVASTMSETAAGTAQAWIRQI
jgi:hypothetical protein